MYCKKILKFSIVISSVLFCSLGLAGQKSSIRALVLSDVHYQPGLEQTSFAEQGGSATDTGDELFGSLVAEVSNLNRHMKPDFALLLGDLPAHHYQDRLAVDKIVLDGLANSLAQTPLFFIPGNNDAPGGNYHSFTQVSDQGESVSPLSSQKGNLPATNVEFCAVTKAPCIINDGDYQGQPFFFGYYSAYPSVSSSLRLIVLNSVIWQNPEQGHGYVADDGVPQDKAAKLELDWLRGQLADSRKNHESVIIAMHIPPGVDSYSGNRFWIESANKSFVDLVDEYRREIVYLVSGHTHMNETHLIEKSGSNKADAVLLGVPGITPLHGNDPGIVMLAISKSGARGKGWSFTGSGSANYRFSPDTSSWSLYYRLRERRDKGESYLKYLLHLPRAAVGEIMDNRFAEGNKSFVPAQGFAAINDAFVVDGS